MASGFKTGGRKKGSPNKLNGTIKEIITQAATEELKNLPALLLQMTPKDKVDFILKLLPYLLPRINPMDEKSVKPPMPLHKLIEKQFSQMNLDKN